MSILDDAIREHLELKRAHGADDSELKKLEDEAFGPPQRPDEIDPFAEAPTEFLATPEETAADAPEFGDEAARSGRRPDIADLQEAPPTPPADLAPPEIDDELSPPLDAPPPSPADAADVPLPPPPGDAPAADLEPPDDAPEPSPAEEEPPAAEHDEEHPAGEHEAVVDADPPAEEPDAIVDQPTQMFDVQAHVDAEAAAEDAEPPTDLPEQPELDVRGPDAEVAGHPPAEAAPEEGSAEFDFFNEQRLSDELDQALEAPLPPTDEHLAMPQYKDAPEPDQGGIFDFESSPSQPREERPYEDDPSQDVLRRADEAERAEEPAPDDEEDETAFDPETGHEDVLEDTPRFLEDAPEDDDLWFEQKPPKDFDLD
jgi:hypothetical protein